MYSRGVGIPVTGDDLRKKLVDIAQSFYGYTVISGRHKTIIDIYNNHTPLAVGYKVKYTDAWCATFGSVVAIKADLTDIIPTECSCPRQIELWKKKGRWCEDDAHVPKPGDYIYYDWQDGSDYAITDNTGMADHVGIICQVTENDILTVIEGNYQGGVNYRSLRVNGRYIRGYGLPDYEGKAQKMEEVKELEYIVNPYKVSIYINTGSKTMAQIKAETGCTDILNGGLFKTMSIPVAQLKVNCKVYANENWGSATYGLAWNGNARDLCVDTNPDHYDNFIGCVGLIYRGQKLSPIQYPSEMAGARQRTAIGVMPDGKIWVYQTKNSTTPEQLQSYAVKAGCFGAIMLDGGASTQGISPAGTLISSSRPLIHNYILIWDSGTPVVETPSKPVQTAFKSNYPEPTRNLKTGCYGTDVKWLQEMLNKALGCKLSVDGSFGPNTRSKLIAFQNKYPSVGVDGIAGKKTIAKLKEVV